MTAFICDVTNCFVPAVVVLKFRGQPGHVHVCGPHEGIDREHADVVASAPLVAAQRCPWRCEGIGPIGDAIPTPL